MPPGSTRLRRFSRGAYFIGKVVWAKGYTELLDLVKQATLGAEADASSSGGSSAAGAAGGGKAAPSAVAAGAAGGLVVDCYGAGEDLEAVKEAAGRAGLPLRFHGAKDHLEESMHEYQVRPAGLGRQLPDLHRLGRRHRPAAGRQQLLARAQPCPGHAHLPLTTPLPTRLL